MSGFVVNPNKGKQKGSVKPREHAWYWLTGSGKKVFVSERKAEELMRQGHMVMMQTQRKDL